MDRKKELKKKLEKIKKKETTKRDAEGVVNSIIDELGEVIDSFDFIDSSLYELEQIDEDVMMRVSGDIDEAFIYSDSLEGFIHELMDAESAITDYLNREL